MQFTPATIHLPLTFSRHFSCSVVHLHSLERFQVFDNGEAIIGRKRWADHPVSSWPVFKLVATVAIAWLGNVVKRCPFEFGGIVAHLDGIELFTACPELIRPLALRRQKRVQIRNRSVMEIR